jgi:methionyl-tRNA synthetase
MGFAKEKIGNHTGKIKKQTGTFHWEGQYRFHCVIFPAMLKAEGSYILPDNVPAMSLNLEGNKLSTSKTGFWLHEYLEELNQQDVYVMR